jgi:hypothetical protein
VALCCGWTVRALKANGNGHSAGCALTEAPGIVSARFDASQPLSLWACPARDDLTQRALILLGGRVAEDLLVVDQARSEPLPEVAVALAAGLPETLPPLPDDDMLRLAAFCDAPDEPADEQRLAEYCRLAHGGDLVSAAAWVRYLEAQARFLITRDAAKVARLAEALGIHGELGEDAIKAVLA